MVTEKSDHDRVTLMSCLEKVVAKIERKHRKCYEYVWIDEMVLNSGPVLFLQ